MRHPSPPHPPPLHSPPSPTPLTTLSPSLLPFTHHILLTHPLPCLHPTHPPTPQLSPLLPQSCNLPSHPLPTSYPSTSSPLSLPPSLLPPPPLPSHCHHSLLTLPSMTHNLVQAIATQQTRHSAAALEEGGGNEGGNEGGRERERCT